MLFTAALRAAETRRRPREYVEPYALTLVRLVHCDSRLQVVSRVERVTMVKTNGWTSAGCYWSRARISSAHMT
jgi:hypothetical protein